MLTCVQRSIVMLLSFATLLSALIACGRSDATNDLAEVVKADFESWVVEEGLPYKDPEFEVTSNDGTFGVVRVTAWFRRSATSPWIEQYDEVRVRKVGEVWQRDSEFGFNLTEAAQSEQDAIASATAIVRDATAQADADARRTASQATSEAQAAERLHAQTATEESRIAEICREVPLPESYGWGVGFESVVEDRTVEIPGRITGNLERQSGSTNLLRFRFVGQKGQQLAIDASTDKDFWTLELRSPSDSTVWRLEMIRWDTDEPSEVGTLKPLQCSGMYSLILEPKNVHTSRYTIVIDVE